MVLWELVNGVCLNARGFMRATRYKVHFFDRRYRDRSFAELPPEYQRCLLVLQNNLRLMVAGQVFYTPYEGLKKCQIQLYGERFRGRYGVQRRRGDTYKEIDMQHVKAVLAVVEEFISSE